MAFPKVIFLGDASKTAAADCLCGPTRSIRHYFRSGQRSSSRSGGVVDIRPWQAGRQKVAIWDYNLCEQFASASHLLMVPSESAFVIWLDPSMSQEELVQSAVRCFDEIHQHVTLIATGRVHVACAVWLGRLSGERSMSPLPSDFDPTACLLSISRATESHWTRFHDSVELHKQMILVHNSARSEELSSFVGYSMRAIMETHYVSDTQQVDKVLARLAELKRQQLFPLLSWATFEAQVNQSMRQPMSNSLLLKVATSLSASGHLLLIDKPGVPRHVVIDVDRAVTWFNQLLTSTELQEASADIGVTPSHFDRLFPKYAPHVSMVIVQLQELQLAFSAASGGSLLKLPALHTTHRQRMNWENLEGGELRAALHLPVLCHSLFPTIQVALGRKFGGISLFVWKSSCCIDCPSGRALVVCACRGHEMTIAWTVSASTIGSQAVTSFWSVLTSVIQGQCTHHVPGISFQFENSITPQEFAALAVASEDVATATLETQNGLSPAEGSLSDEDVGFEAVGAVQKVGCERPAVPPPPVVNGAGILLPEPITIEGSSSSDGEGDDTSVVAEVPTTLLTDLDHGFTISLSEVLDSDRGRMNWERLAAGFGFSTEQVVQWRHLLRNGPSNGPTRAVLQAAHETGRGTVEALRDILLAMGRDDMRKELDLAVERFVQRRTIPDEPTNTQLEPVCPPPLYDPRPVFQQSLPPPNYSAVPDATYPTVGVTVEENPRILICYYWEDDAHAEDVRKFCLALRKERFNARLDQFEKDRINVMGAVPWKEKEYQLAKFVLVICSKSYREASQGSIGESPNHPFGSFVEYEYNRLIMRDVITTKNKERFVIPILFDGFSGHNFFKVVPISLQAGTGYSWPLKQEDLFYRLKDKEKYTAPPVSSRPPLTPKVDQYSLRYKNGQMPPRPSFAINSHNRLQPRSRP